MTRNFSATDESMILTALNTAAEKYGELARECEARADGKRLAQQFLKQQRDCNRLHNEISDRDDALQFTAQE